MIQQHSRFFPTHVFTFQLTDHRNEEWLRYIKAHAKPWHAGARTGPQLHREELFSSLIETVQETVAQMNEKLGFDDHYQSEVTSMHGQVLDANVEVHSLIQANNIWSVIYQVAGPESESHNPVEFFDVRSLAHMLEPARKKNVPDNASLYALNLPPGWGMVFPAWLRYRIPAVPAAGRCSIACNILLRGEFDHIESKQWAKI